MCKIYSAIPSKIKCKLYSEKFTMATLFILRNSKLYSLDYYHVAMQILDSTKLTCKSI